jgi:hypothetical protein
MGLNYNIFFVLLFWAAFLFIDIINLACLPAEKTFGNFLDVQQKAKTLEEEPAEVCAGWVQNRLQRTLA